jgi:hypothetical protein
MDEELTPHDKPQLEPVFKKRFHADGLERSHQLSARRGFELEKFAGSRKRAIT